MDKRAFFILSPLVFERSRCLLLAVAMQGSFSEKTAGRYTAGETRKPPLLSVRCAKRATAAERPARMSLSPFWGNMENLFGRGCETPPKRSQAKRLLGVAALLLFRVLVFFHLIQKGANGYGHHARKKSHAF